MCKNNLEADLEQDPLIVVSPIAVGKSSNASFDAPDPGAAEATKSQDRRRIILFSVLTVCIIGGSFLAGCMLTKFQYGKNVSTEITNDDVSSSIQSLSSNIRMSALHTINNSDEEQVDGISSASVNNDDGMLRKKSSTHHNKHGAKQKQDTDTQQQPPPPLDTRIIDMVNYYYSTYRPMDHNFLSYLASSSFARDQIIELMVNEYTSSLSLEVEIKDQMKNAIEILDLREKDGEPVAVVGHDFLFVGSVGAAMNEEILRSYGITHIVNWSSTAKCNSFDGIEYLCFPGIRTYKDMKEHIDVLDEAVEFIESARKSGGKALSHCWFGKNRSVTLLVAYLMKYEDMTRSGAIELVQRTRSIADPYLDVLHLYEKTYLK